MPPPATCKAYTDRYDPCGELEFGQSEGVALEFGQRVGGVPLPRSSQRPPRTGIASPSTPGPSILLLMGHPVAPTCAVDQSCPPPGKLGGGLYVPGPHLDLPISLQRAAVGSSGRCSHHRRTSPDTSSQGRTSHAQLKHHIEPRPIPRLLRVLLA